MTVREEEEGGKKGAEKKKCMSILAKGSLGIEERKRERCYLP